MAAVKGISIKLEADNTSAIYIPVIHTLIKTDVKQVEKVKDVILGIDLNRDQIENIVSSLNTNFNLLEDIQLARTPHLGFCVITNECNMDCSFCFANKNEVLGDTFNIEWLDKLKSILPETSFQEVRVSGGEPLLFFDKVKEIQKRVNGIKIYTNGSLINDEVAQWAIDTNTKFYIALDYTIPGFEGHAADQVRANLDDLSIKYPKLKDLIEIAITYPNDKLDSIDEYRDQKKEFEKSLVHDMNYVCMSDKEITYDTFEKELDLIVSGELDINESVFKKQLRYISETLQNYINVESCSPNITINSLGDISSCFVNGSNISHDGYDKFKISNIDDFTLQKYLLYTFQNKKLGPCKEDCPAKWFCGNICWANIQHNRHNCDITKKAIFSLLYLILNSTQLDMYELLNYKRLDNILANGDNNGN